ncbi:major facilitator superfamily domain-containing protein 8 [Eurytemora carolleeae]|uniref:major facilitator superfamily domain-containing protein 8 n=1 Tax=Eurytemora carolleeae TaxID=1294199 RepID=UPI000C762FE7|nr:major facilitator superfamily domain-containing protein 8 [Eurytemora carolleeae]|eukprot:XP_023341021.1 major facilitator superfamily domain-containing protein 8-like [Eurytemora affinis]
MVAINPLGQLIFSPIFGWLGNRFGSIRLICLISCIAYVIGNVMYSCLSLFPHDPDEDVETRGRYRYIAMFLARLLVGISSANQAPIRSYVASATWKHERNMHISILSLFQALGFMIGPAIQSALVPVGCSHDYPTGEIQFDMYTISGWLSAGVGIISFILFLPGIFSEHYISKIEAERIKTNDNEKIELGRPDLFAVTSCAVSFFVFLFNFILLETIGTPLCMDQLGWDEGKSITNLGILMSVGAVISMFAYASVAPLTRLMDERLVYIGLGLIPMLLGRIVMLPMGKDFPPLKPDEGGEGGDGDGDGLHLYYQMFTRTQDSCQDESGTGGCDLEWCKTTPAITEVQFYLGYIISAISFPYCMAICQALFSKLIGPRPQGVWMGLFTSVGSLARICGPIFVSKIYQSYGTYWTFGLCILSLVISLVVSGLTYKRLIPIEDRLLPRIEITDDQDQGTGDTDEGNYTSF